MASSGEARFCSSLRTEWSMRMFTFTTKPQRIINPMHTGREMEGPIKLCATTTPAAA
jgi:hypothetical protein